MQRVTEGVTTTGKRRKPMISAVQGKQQNFKWRHKSRTTAPPNLNLDHEQNTTEHVVLFFWLLVKICGALGLLSFTSTVLCRRPASVFALFWIWQSVNSTKMNRRAIEESRDDHSLVVGRRAPVEARRRSCPRRNPTSVRNPHRSCISLPARRLRIFQASMTMPMMMQAAGARRQWKYRC